MHDDVRVVQLSRRFYMSRMQIISYYVYVLVATDLYSLVLASLAAFYLLGPACALNDMLLMMLRPCV